MVIFILLSLMIQCLGFFVSIVIDKEKIELRDRFVCRYYRVDTIEFITECVICNKVYDYLLIPVYFENFDTDQNSTYAFKTV